MLKLPTINKFITEIDETTVSMNITLCNLPEYKGKSREQQKEKLEENYSYYFQTSHIQDLLPYTSTLTNGSITREHHSESYGNHSIINLDLFNYEAKHRQTTTKYNINSSSSGSRTLYRK